MNQRRKIELNNHSIEYKLIRSTKRKTISLQIMVDQGLVIRCPNKAKISDIENLIHKKTKWIVSHLQKYHDMNESKIVKEYISGDTLLYLGKLFLLNLLPGKVSRINLEQQNQKINFICRVEKKEDPKYKERFLVKWYKLKLGTLISEIISSNKDQFQKSPSSIKIRSYKRRWGSTSGDGKISFNWKLMLAPFEVIEYVVIHELSHLIQMNHSKEYWNLMYLIDPKYKEKRNWLKKNGSYLDLKIRQIHW